MLSDTQRFGHKGQWSHQTSTGWFVFATIEVSAFALQSISPLAPQLQILAISGAALFNWLTSVIIKHLWFTINATLPHRIRYAKYVYIFGVVFKFFFLYKNNFFIAKKQWIDLAAFWPVFCSLWKWVHRLELNLLKIYCVWVWYRLRPHICEKVPDRLIIAMDCSSKW